jgi:di/tripeptidase
MNEFYKLQTTVRSSNKKGTIYPIYYINLNSIQSITTKEKEEITDGNTKIIKFYLVVNNVDYEYDSVYIINDLDNEEIKKQNLELVEYIRIRLKGLVHDIINSAKDNSTTCKILNFIKGYK